MCEHESNNPFQLIYLRNHGGITKRATLSRRRSTESVKTLSHKIKQDYPRIPSTPSHRSQPSNYHHRRRTVSTISRAGNDTKKQRDNRIGTWRRRRRRRLRRRNWANATIRSFSLSLFASIFLNGARTMHTPRSSSSSKRMTLSADLRTPGRLESSSFSLSLSLPAFA